VSHGDSNSILFGDIIPSPGTSVGKQKDSQKVCLFVSAPSSGHSYYPPVKPAEQQLPVTLLSDSANDLYKDKRIMAKLCRPSAHGIAVIDNAFCGKAF